MGVFSTSKYVLVLLIMEPINHRCKLKVSKQAAWPRKVVIPSWTSQNPSLHYESLWGQIGRQSWHTHTCTHTCTRTRSCCSFILIGPLQRVMIGYAWLSKAVVFGATATPPDASDLNSPLCRPGCCGTSFCKYPSPPCKYNVRLVRLFHVRLSTYTSKICISDGILFKMQLNTGWRTLQSATSLLVSIITVYTGMKWFWVLNINIHTCLLQQC